MEYYYGKKLTNREIAMSNRIYVQYFKMEKVEEDGTPVKVSGKDKDRIYGWGIWDDEEQFFDWWFTLDELKKKLNKNNVVDFLNNMGPYSSLGDFALEKGIYWNGDWISGEELRKIQVFEENDEENDV